MAKEYSYGIIPYLFTKQGVEILLMKSSKKSLTYDFIKGKIENESILECIEREVFEEIGVKIDIKDLDINYGLLKQNSKRKNIGLYFINFDKYVNVPQSLSYKEVYETKLFNINKLPTISNNQRLIITKIHKRFKLINNFKVNFKFNSI